MPIRENKNANFVNSRKFSSAKITESTVFHLVIEAIYVVCLWLQGTYYENVIKVDCPYNLYSIGLGCIEHRPIFKTGLMSWFL